MISSRHAHAGVAAAALAVAAASPAAAFPGFFIGKKPADRRAHSSQVVVMRKGDASVVTVAPDYEGPLDAFAVVLPVPADVTVENVATLKGEAIRRVEQISAPRFHEFWEQDPCDPAPPEQIWERSKMAVSGTDFLGGGMPQVGTEKVAKELLMRVETDFKEAGEYKFTVLDEAQSKAPGDWLKQQGYAVTDAATQAIRPYADAGMKFLVAEVDSKKIELLGDGRAQLSPIRYASQTPIDTLPTKLGLLNSPGDQELLVYVLHPDQQFEVKNYENVFPPTNIEVDFVVKERMGEFYAGLHDLMLKKNPKAFLVEYAWPTKGCGQPCATEPLMIHEILSLGGDVFEQSVPEEEKNPEPPELTAEEEEKQKAKLEALEPKERAKTKKQMEEDRQELARRKALLDRQAYLMTRLHYRYGKDTMPEDVKLTAGSKQVAGGTGVPKGQDTEISTSVEPAKTSELQTRYNFFHPWKAVMKCENPQRGKWGKPPRTYRGLNKIWVAEDIARKNRKQIKPASVVRDAIPALDLAPARARDAGVDGGADAGTGDAEKSENCGCRAPGSAPGGALGASFGLLLAGAWVRRRINRRPGR